MAPQEIVDNPLDSGVSVGVDQSRGSPNAAAAMEPARDGYVTGGADRAAETQA